MFAIHAHAMSPSLATHRLRPRCKTTKIPVVRCQAAPTLTPSPNSYDCLSHATSTTHDQSIGRRSLLVAAATAIVLSSAIVPSAEANVPRTTSAGENVGFLSNEEVDRDRAVHRMKRAFDGKVAIQSKKDKRWFDLKVEPNMPGLIYFRRDDGQVYYIAYGSLAQCDLADDDMVGALSDDDWETAIRNVEFAGEKQGQTEKLELTREGFYSITSLLKGEE